MTATDSLGPARLVQVAQRAADLDGAAAWYSLVLGREPSGRFDPPGLLFFDLGGGTRLLLERGAPSAVLYLRVDDVVSEVERLRAAGVTVETEPHMIFRHGDDRLGPAGAEEWHAFVRDPDRNLVALVEHRPT